MSIQLRDTTLGRRNGEAAPGGADGVRAVCSRNAFWQSSPAHRGSAIGALVTCLPGVVPELAPLMVTCRAILPLEACGADELVSMVRAMKNPALVAVVSISPYFLETARGVLAPHIGKRHSLETYCLGEGENKDLTAADLVFCDTLVRGRVKARNLSSTESCLKAQPRTSPLQLRPEDRQIDWNMHYIREVPEKETNMSHKATFATAILFLSEHADRKNKRPFPARDGTSVWQFLRSSKGNARAIRSAARTEEPRIG